MQYITLLDYILLPLYLGLFYWRVRKVARTYTEPDLKKYFFTAFWLRMFGSFAYSMVVQYYYGYGDSFTYYTGGSFFTEQIKASFSNIEYLFASFETTAEWYNSIS